MDLALKQAGILDESGNLTSYAIKNADAAMSENSTINNPKVIAELTKDGSSIADWAKMRTPPVELSNGQKIDIHFYQNRATREVNYNVDFKVKGPVSPFSAKPQIEPAVPAYVH